MRTGTGAVRSLVAAAFTGLASIASANAADITGPARILDGDTVEIGVARIRIHGIDAPETDQVCLDAAGKASACGTAARQQLERIGVGNWTCIPRELDRYGRTIATCTVGGRDVGREMVKSGQALAFVRYSRDYEAEEVAARRARAGMWSGAFVAAWDWRARNAETVILGAASVPKNAQAVLIGRAEAADAPDSACAIKGNVNRSGECIYHRPGQRHYDKVNMAAKGKRWFCTPIEAEAAGCRPAKI
jgi:endonuclease YncB( thermonuclease family)